MSHRAYVDLIEYTKLGAIPSVLAILHEATEQGILKDVVDGRDYNGNTAVIWASHYCNIDLVRIFITAGADLHVVSSNGMTALAYAQSKQYQDMIDLLTANLK